MPDISMCVNSRECPLNRNCYRAEESGTAPSGVRQAWMSFAWTKSEDGAARCDAQIPMFEIIKEGVDTFDPDYVARLDEALAMFKSKEG